MFDLTSASELHQLDLEAGGRAESTRYWCRTVEARFITYLRERDPTLPAKLPLTLLAMDQARGFVLWLKAEHRATNTLTGQPMGRSARSVQDHVRALKTFARFCFREGMLAADPLAQLKLPKSDTKLIEVFSPEQVRALIREAERRPEATRNIAILYFLLATGVRVSELAALKLEDVDCRERRARVFGKGRKERRVQFDATTAKLLLRYRAERGDGPPGTFFVSHYGEPLNRNAVRQMMSKLGKAAGVTGVRCSPHTLRHTFATRFLAAHPGALFHLQELLGHTDLTMVRRYAKIVRGLEVLDGPGTIEAMGLDKITHRRTFAPGDRF